MRRKLLPVVVILIAIAGLVFFYLPNVQADSTTITSSEPTATSSDPSTWTCTGGCELLDNPTSAPVPPAPGDAPVIMPEPPLANRVPIGTASVTLIVKFVDGSEKVMTSDFALLSVVIEGKEVSYMQYKVEVAFENLGEVYISGLKYGLYLVPSSGAAGQAIQTGGVGDIIRVPLGTRLMIVDMVVQASQIDAFFVTYSIPDGNYALRFWAGFFWAGTDVAVLNGVAATGSGAISGPDLPATITKPAGSEMICFDRNNICIV